METVTEDELCEKLSNHYGGDNSSREFVKNVRRDGHESTGSVVYSLSGSPPKGYAIVIPDLRKVNLYNHQGEWFQILRDTVVEGIVIELASGEFCGKILEVGYMPSVTEFVTRKKC